MFGATVTFTVLAVCTAVAGFFTWERNKGVSFLLGGATIVLSSIALILAFVGAVVGFFKILPILLLLVGCYILYRRLGSAR
ncbi:hypothetical protein M0E82_08410 [Corynebacterium sp. P7202]|uniref:Uncharacterized protein n=1 Tax=Corynebacterium pygosceleis TaxID=2800406 RepID=A0A9Q4C8W8_9CORY|nr:hypothetical protein [Corynebacterium pygosceleis]MCK7638016.1 hypothetical protein [Corynebacterium pygosceleis]MCX7444437.1 hypothetical protein [Corynebacterium pygosceleis]MCX7468732.1 hypothetical protein [Corynebacterium pygosceleis]